MEIDTDEDRFKRGKFRIEKSTDIVGASPMINLDEREKQGAIIVSKPEWGFAEPPEQVDIEQLWADILMIPAIYAHTYIAELRTKAPRTYRRLREARILAGCTIFNWLPHSTG